jgi:hypothetical protein
MDGDVTAIIWRDKTRGGKVDAVDLQGETAPATRHPVGNAANQHPPPRFHSVVRF